MFMPLLVLAHLFRKTRAFKTKYQKLKEKLPSITILDDSNIDSQKTKEFTLPWWFKIVLYSICCIIMVASIFFTIIKGKF
jgi:hypothetical protein